MNDHIAKVVADLKIDETAPYLVFVRDWWHGRILDLVAVHERGPRTLLFCQAGRRRTSPSKVLAERDLTTAEWSRLLSRVKDLRLLEIRSQVQPIIATHFDDHYAVKCVDGANRFSVSGGKHADPGLGEFLDEILRLVPRLVQFYRVNTD